MDTCIDAREDGLYNEEHADCQAHQRLWLWQLLKSLGLLLVALVFLRGLGNELQPLSSGGSLADFFITNFHKAL